MPVAPQLTKSRLINLAKLNTYTAETSTARALQSRVKELHKNSIIRTFKQANKVFGNIEINEIFPPNIEFEVSYSADHSWQGDHFFGCSVASAEKTLRTLGYSLVNIEYNNAFFVSNSLADKFDLKHNVFELYDQGYRNKIDRKAKFTGNSDVEYLLTASPKECGEKLETLFLKYKGNYLLNIY